MVFDKKEYLKEYYERNKDRILKIQQELYQKNKEEINKKHRKYYQEHKEKINEQKKEYMKEYLSRSEVIERTREYCSKPEVKKRKKEYNKEYHKKNKQGIKKQKREYYSRPKVKKGRKKYKKEYHKKKKDNDIIYITKKRLRNLFVRSLKYYTQTGKIMTSKMYGINYKEIIEHLKPLPKDMENYHIHHIKPLFTFDFNDLEEIKKAFAPENHILITIEEHKKINHWDLKQ